MPTVITKGAVFVFILILIAVVAVTIVAQIAEFEATTFYDVTAIVTSLEGFITAAADKTIEQQDALNGWIQQTEIDLNLVDAEMQRLCDLADNVITPGAPTP
ncbi:MAG: hypothetical protein AAF725_25410 [Acidobacteriota bacterium]